MVKKISCIIMGVVISIGFSACNINHNNYITSVVAYDSSDVDVEYDLKNAVKVNLSDDEIVVDGHGIKVDNNVLTIKKAGTYVLSGNLDEGKIVCDAPKKEVKIVLDNAQITNSSDSPMKFENGKKVYIIFAPESNNKIIANNLNKSVQSNVATTISGSGLTEFRGEIQSNENLVFSDGKLNIISNENGINCEQSITFLGGVTTVNSDLTGVLSEKIINVKNGTINIKSGDKKENAQTSSAIKSNKAITINNGTLFLNSHSNAIECDGEISISDGKFKIETNSSGLSSLNMLNLSGGDFDIKSKISSLSSKKISISGGYFNLSSENDGINAVVENGGEIDISDGTLKIKSEKSSIITSGKFNLFGGTLILNAKKDFSPLMASTSDIYGGLCFATGSELGALKNASQHVIIYNFEKMQPNNKRFTLTDKSDNVVASFVPEFDYDSVVIVSSAFSKSANYNVLVGGNVTEKFSSGISTSGKLENGSKKGIIKVS